MLLPSRIWPFLWADKHSVRVIRRSSTTDGTLAQDQWSKKPQWPSQTVALKLQLSSWMSLVLLLCNKAKSPVHNFICFSLLLWQSWWDGAFRTWFVPSSQEYASNTLPPSLARLFFWGPLLPGPRSWDLLGGSCIVLWAVQQWS